MNESIRYIISFLLGKETCLAYLVSYGEETAEAKVVIEPSTFFEEGAYLTPKSMPVLPLKEIGGTPLLYGEPEYEIRNGVLYTKADIVASTFFLISRYEECIRPEVRDMHGRFIGRESLPYRAGFLMRPIVDEYGKLLRYWLREVGVCVEEPKAGFQHIWLTHDVDRLWTWTNPYRALRASLRRVVFGEKNVLLPLKAIYNYKKYDPIYTFPEIVQWDWEVMESYGKDLCKSLYFFMGCIQATAFDSGYMARPSCADALITFVKSGGGHVGYHVSYAASLDSRLLKSEIQRIQQFTEEPIRWSRNHYLSSREPRDYDYLIQAGITDDFTMGYADVVGFRLGTCRPVRWIDPESRKLTDLVLHPMTTMECTLDAYMHIQEEDTAFAYVVELLEQIRRHHGEVVLLWHNNSFDKESSSYQRSLYQRVLMRLIQMNTSKEK